MKVRAANSARHNEQGYMLITLILFVALLAISLTALAPEMVHQMKRDREEELIHRGVQYSRAIQHFVKQNGRYPTTIDELLTSGNMHFLRKRYKDPITGKDFKILHMGDVQMTFGGGIQGATPIANLAAGAAAAGNQGGGFGQSIFASNGFGNNNSLGGNSPGNSLGGGGTFGGNSGSTFGNSGNSFGGGSTFGGNNSSFGGNNNNSLFGGQSNQNQNTNQPGSSTTAGNQGSDSSQQNSSGQQGQGSGSNNQVFGGGPIVGVVSTSKDKTIRVFNKKDKYNEWQFIYDPSSDTGGLLNMPNVGQQAGGMGGTMNVPNNQNGNQNGQQGGFGFSGGSPFGSQGGQQQPTPVEQPSPYPPTPQQPQQQFPPEQGPQ